MHHCIGTYAEEVRGGRYYVYSIRRDAERLATAGLVLDGARAKLAELRGPCNAPAPKQITATVERWLRTQAPRRDGETMTEWHVALGALEVKPKRKPNRLMMEADTAIGPRERKPKRRNVPSPLGA
jgi:PcfJ-like protein